MARGGLNSRASNGLNFFPGFQIHFRIPATARLRRAWGELLRRIFHARSTERLLGIPSKHS